MRMYVSMWCVAAMDADIYHKSSRERVQRRWSDAMNYFDRLGFYNIGHWTNDEWVLSVERR